MNILNIIIDTFSNQNFSNMCYALAITSIGWSLMVQFLTNLPTLFMKTSGKRGSVDEKEASPQKATAYCGLAE